MVREESTRTVHEHPSIVAYNACVRGEQRRVGAKGSRCLRSPKPFANNVFIVFFMVCVDRIVRPRRLRNRTSYAKIILQQENNFASACDMSISRIWVIFELKE
jgi:hypothetical protein